MSIVETIQQQVADQIASDSFFTNITVLTENVGDIINLMEQALGAETSLGGKAGAFVLVMSPDADQTWTQQYGVVLDKVKIHVQVTVDTKVAEDPAIGVGVTSLAICEEICRILSQFYPGGATSPLSPETPTIQLMDRNDNGSTRLCKFTTSGQNSAVGTYAATPGISETGGIVTLTCGTAGAAIFYTLDGSNPGPRNTNAVLYTAPFTPGSGLTLKARSFLAGYLNSQTAQQTT
jgi:hypothetical protein